MSKRITLKEYLRELVKRAHGTPQLANFIREHDLVGTTRGSPHWRRNAKFYERNTR